MLLIEHLGNIEKKMSPCDNPCGHLESFLCAFLGVIYFVIILSIQFYILAFDITNIYLHYLCLS